MSKNKNLCIDQFVAGLHFGDAITSEVLTIQKILRDNGFISNIYSNYQHTGEREKKISLNYTGYQKSSPQNIILYHYSTHSPITDFIKNTESKKILRYHNITPYKYFVGINNKLAEELKNGIEELKNLSDLFLASFSDSDYNSNDLSGLGFKNLYTLPIMFDFSKYKEHPDKEILSLKNNHNGTLLFVGRIVPNKKQEDIIKVFYYYKNFINKNARLFLVGSWGSSEKYYFMLKGLINKLELEDVFFTNHITDRELYGYYKISDIFLCMSEHEGFGVPIVESMYFNIPIIALNKGAVPETLGNAGILVNNKNYRETAELIDIVLTRSDIRNRIIQNQKKRLEYFSIENESKRILDLITKFI